MIGMVSGCVINVVLDPIFIYTFDLKVAGAFSDTALAASSISHRCTRLVASAILGFGQGFQPMAGYCWGAKRYKRVREAFWSCGAIGAATGAVLGIVMLISTPRIIGAFAKDNEEILAIGSLMIGSQCIIMAFHVWVVIANGLFQALGRAISAGFLGLSRQLICLIPCVPALSALFEVTGLALAQAVADLLCVVIVLPMVLKLMKEIKGMIAAEQGCNAPQSAHFTGEV